MTFQSSCNHRPQLYPAKYHGAANPCSAELRQIFVAYKGEDGK
jgi:hypothetical protein